MNNKTIQELREKVFTAIGEASMCWIPTPQGIFDSTRAEKVGKALVDEILSRAEQEAKEEPLAKISTPDLIAELERRGAIFPAIYYGRDGGLFESGGKERDLEKAANYHIYIYPSEDFKEAK